MSLQNHIGQSGRMRLNRHSITRLERSEPVVVKEVTELAPDSGKRYRFKFAGIHEPNMRVAIVPAMAKKQGYEAFPTQSVPVELVADKTIRLRFILRKADLQDVPPDAK
jgi:hypothetical protein